MTSKKARNRAAVQKLRHNTKQPQTTPQPQNKKSKSSSQTIATNFAPANPSPQPAGLPSNPIDGTPNLADHYNDKVARLRALHARWAYEDTEKEALVEEALQARQRNRCKELGLIVFGYTLHEAQVEAIQTLFFEQRDLLLLAKTGFGKSLIFQLLPFFTPVPRVALTLMPLKLLQAKQYELINRLPGGNAIVLNGENNSNAVFTEVARGDYTHVFTSPKIAISRKFKKGLLDHSSFTDRFCLLAVDEIQLVEEWDKNFRPMYAEIEKVRKRIPCNIPLLGVSATLTKSVRSRVVEKAGFLPNYRLLQTSLDRQEIMQLHRFMKHPRSSCLDLQFVLPPSAKEAKDIQKTIIFVNSVNEIRVIISIFHAWMKKLGYPAESTQ